MTFDIQDLRRVAKVARANQRISHARDDCARVEDAPPWASR
jgi:hypothetical protein